MPYPRARDAWMTLQYAGGACEAGPVELGEAARRLRASLRADAPAKRSGTYPAWPATLVD